MSAWFGRLWSGLRLAWQGLRLAFPGEGRPVLRFVLCLVPSLLGALVLVFVAASLASWAAGFVHKIVGHESKAGAVGEFLLGLLLVLLSIFAAGLLSFVVAVIASAPVSSYLSAQAESEAGGDAPPPLSWAGEVREAARGLFHALLRLGLYLGVSLPCLVLPLVVPFLVVITVPVSVMATLLFVVYDVMDPALSRRNLGFFEKWSYVRSHLPECLGLGLLTTPLCGLPLLNLFFTPASALCGGYLYASLAKGQGTKALSPGDPPRP